MRPSTEDLIRIRDGEPVDAVLMAEVTSSPDLQHEVRRLAEVRVGLKSLPDFTPPADIWDRIQAAAAEPVQAESKWHWPAKLTMAASVALLALLILGRMSGVPNGQQVTQGPPPSQVVAERSDAGNALDPRVTTTLASFMAESKRLERVIAGFGQPSLVNAATAVTIAELEDRILWIDDQLSRARVSGLNQAQVVALWEERVELMNSLAAVRYAQAQRFAF